MERLSHNHSDNSNELLSAYIDDAVDLVERRRAEQYIASCAACAQEVQELRMFRELLRDLPNVQPRRSFTLDPATAVPPRRLLFPTFRWASLVAAALFLVVVGVDTLVVGRNPAETMSFSTAAAPAAESAQKTNPAGAPQLGGSDAAAGSAETMMMPQGSPAASPSSAPVAAAEASPAAPTRQTAVANDAVPESVTGAYPFEAPAASPAPAVVGGEPMTGTQDNAAGGSAEENRQFELRADEPAAADTVQITQDATPQGSWWSSYTLRIAEVVLGLIALILGGAALWTWRRQM